MKIRDVMTTDVIAVAPSTPVKEVAEQLFRTRITGVPVIEDGWVVGVVSELEIPRFETGTDQRLRLLDLAPARGAIAEGRPPDGRRGDVVAGDHRGA
jgi:CBS domain-containing protein